MASRTRGQRRFRGGGGWVGDPVMQESVLGVESHNVKLGARLKAAASIHTPKYPHRTGTMHRNWNAGAATMRRLGGGSVCEKIAAWQPHSVAGDELLRIEEYKPRFA